MVEREAGHDHHAAQDEGEEHQRHHQSFVERDAQQVDAGRRPQHRERQRQAHPSRLERRGGAGPAERHGDIPDEGHEHVRDDADRDREGEPLRERRDEAQVGIEAPARIHIAAAGARHRRREDGVGHRRQHGRERREGKGFQHERPDAGDVALDHERDHVDARADHRADAGGGQAGEAHLAGEAWSPTCAARAIVELPARDVTSHCAQGIPHCVPSRRFAIPALSSVADA